MKNKLLKTKIDKVFFIIVISFFILWLIANIIYAYIMFCIDKSWWLLDLIMIPLLGVPVLITFVTQLYFIKFLILKKEDYFICTLEILKGVVSIINILFYTLCFINDDLWKLSFWGAITIVAVCVIETIVKLIKKYCKKEKMLSD